MKFSLDTDSPTPIFQQIIDELERQILTGELAPDAFLTSVREFALRHSVNPNTVAKAYQQLQVMGLVEAVRGMGLKVRAVSSKRVDGRKHELLIAKIDECMELAMSLGTSTQKLIDLIRERSRK